MGDLPDTFDEVMREGRAAREERRREVALECASRAWAGRAVSYSVGGVVLETARDFEKYLRGGA